MKATSLLTCSKRRAGMAVLAGFGCLAASLSAQESAPEGTVPPDLAVPVTEPAAPEAPPPIEIALLPQARSGENFTGLNFEALSFKGSIMFQEDELGQIYGMLQNQGPTSPAEVTETPQDAGSLLPQEEPQQIVAPTFYLESILYYAPENWAIWVNGKRVRKGEEGPGFTIDRTTSDVVELVATGLDLDNISPGWQGKLVQYTAPQLGDDGKPAPIPAGSWDYGTEDRKILINSSTRSVKFALGLHQTFVTHTMEVVEGFQPQTIIVRSENPATPSTNISGGQQPPQQQAVDIFDSL